MLRGDLSQIPEAVVYFLIVLGVGWLFLFVPRFARTLRRAIASTRWPKADGSVISSEVDMRLLGRGGMAHGGGRVHQTHIFVPRIIYEYAVNGVTYSSGTLSFGRVSYSMKSATQIVSEYTEGKPVAVHYDPGNPDIAVLETAGVHFAVARAVFVTCLGLVFLGLGIWGTLAS